MNKKFFLLLALGIMAFANGQETPDYRLRAFAFLDLNLGTDVRSISKNENYSGDNHFTYGLSSQVGYQPLTWFGFATGPRYDYIMPNHHALYWSGKGYFFFTPPEDEAFGFISLSYGKQINRNVNGTGGVVAGVSLGKISIIDNQLAHKFELKFDYHFTNHNKFPMIGLSYGLVLFSNKALQ